MSEQFVFFRYPKRFVNPDEPDALPYEEVRLPWVQGKSLKYYYMDTRYDHHLGQKNTTHTVRKKDSREPVRTSYIPQPGEIFLFIPVSRATA